MCSVTVILAAFFVQGLATEQVSQVQKSHDDMMVDKLVDRLVDKLVGGMVRLPSTGLQARSPLLSPASSKYSKVASLPGPTAFKHLVVDEFEKLNSRGCRVATRAEENTALSTESARALPSKFMYADGLKTPSTKEKVKEMAGVSLPFDNVWDPLQISTRVPEGQLLFFRAAELKHGRVCMLAFIGLIVGERHDFIPYLSTGIDPSLPAYALGDGEYFPFLRPDLVEQGLSSYIPLAQFWPIVVIALLAEEARYEYYRKESPTPVAPGDYGWDPLRIRPKDPKALKELQTKEINNGRLAMFAVAGILAQEMLTGKKVLLEFEEFLKAR